MVQYTRVYRVRRFTAVYIQGEIRYTIIGARAITLDTRDTTSRQRFRFSRKNNVLLFRYLFIILFLIW